MQPVLPAGPRTPPFDFACWASPSGTNTWSPFSFHEIFKKSWKIASKACIFIFVNFLIGHPRDLSMKTQNETEHRGKNWNFLYLSGAPASIQNGRKNGFFSTFSKQNFLKKSFWTYVFNEKLQHFLQIFQKMLVLTNRIFSQSWKEPPPPAAQRGAGNVEKKEVFKMCTLDV